MLLIAHYSGLCRHQLGLNNRNTQDTRSTIKIAIKQMGILKKIPCLKPHEFCKMLFAFKKIVSPLGAYQKR
jgi:hypothetical protein